MKAEVATVTQGQELTGSHGRGVELPQSSLRASPLAAPEAEGVPCRCLRAAPAGQDHTAAFWLYARYSLS